MADPVISVRNIGKKYTLGTTFSHDTLRDQVAHTFKLLSEKISNSMLKESSFFNKAKLRGNVNGDFWALKNISFDVPKGEILGIIGKNGAGKSTLLKILSGITEPTEGEIRIRGRVASLLEVGTGFHPELTGRENIFLNGAILGMRRAEINKNFDKIVTFAGVERFIDTPVKRYSSGMYLRLAFGVAAHLESEILLIDEVLAVGDIGFQKKCLTKMDDVTKKGRTVIFVSHNMNAIQSLCNKTLLLDNGFLTFIGRTEDSISKYLMFEVNNTGKIEIKNKFKHDGSKTKAFKKITFKGENGKSKNIFDMGCDVFVEIELEIKKPIKRAIIGVGFISEAGNMSALFGSFDAESILELPEGNHTLFGKIPKLQLSPGTYSIVVDLRKDAKICIDRIENVIDIIIQPRDIWRSGWLPHDKQRSWIGESSWEIK